MGGAVIGSDQMGTFVAPGIAKPPSMPTSSGGFIKRDGSNDSAESDVDLSSVEWMSESQMTDHIDEATVTSIDEAIGVILSAQVDYCR